MQQRIVNIKIALIGSFLFWLIVALFSAQWLFELYSFRIELFITCFVLARYMIMMSFAANFYILQKYLRTMALKKRTIVSLLLAIIVNGLLYRFIFAGVYIFVAFATWDGRF